MLFKLIYKHRLKKNAKVILNNIKKMYETRYDIIDQKTRNEFSHHITALKSVLKTSDITKIEDVINNASRWFNNIYPRNFYNTVKEQFEMIIVAIVIAMAFRTYFLQPFKIPTGSMQPTLYGIHAEPADQPGLFDIFPLKIFKWFITGKWYTEVIIDKGGILYSIGRLSSEDPYYYCRIGENLYKIPPHVMPQGYNIGDYIPSNARIWSGYVIAGDHVFVDRARWYFTFPKRGDVIVFETKNIPGLLKNTFYIKRLIGLPEEKIQISPPAIIINSSNEMELPRSIKRIIEENYPYHGYTLPADNEEAVMSVSCNSYKIPKNSYFVLGDNTLSSRDSRYWGVVPRENIVGPAFFVYWPLIRIRFITR